MSSGRDRDRDRRAAAAASARTNEYFVPREGIDREVITADVCRYLGNDALVRPGNYEDPRTREIKQGYFITAYRNLTTEMIADLKADSQRWDAERRQTASRGQASNAEYRTSTTHQSRQYYGPTEVTNGLSAPGYPATSSGGGSQSQGVYDQGYAPNYAQPSGYAAPATGYAQQEGYSYVAGANMDIDPRSGGRPPVQAVPRSGGQQYATTPTSYAQADSRNAYYSPQPGPVSSIQPSQYQTNPTDPYYGRGPSYDSQDVVYDSRGYPDSGSYSQSMGSSSTAATSGSSRRTEPERDRHRDRDSDRHRRHR